MSFSRLYDNGIEMYSRHNEGEPIIAERFIRNSKHAIYINMTVVSKNVYTNKLDEIVDKYNKTYQRKITMLMFRRVQIFTMVFSIKIKILNSNWVTV